jgi:hypothetical protein
MAQFDADGAVAFEDLRRQHSAKLIDIRIKEKAGFSRPLFSPPRRDSRGQRRLSALPAQFWSPCEPIRKAAVKRDAI